jgi:hypothetical protein
MSAGGGGGGLGIWQFLPVGCFVHFNVTARQVSLFKEKVTCVFIFIGFYAPLF